jgi:hypothetical protein
LSNIIKCSYLKAKLLKLKQMLGCSYNQKSLRYEKSLVEFFFKTNYYWIPQSTTFIVSSKADSLEDTKIIELSGWTRKETQWQHSGSLGGWIGSIPTYTDWCFVIVGTLYQHNCTQMNDRS